MQHQTTHPIQPHQLLRPARAAIYARVSSDQQTERQTIASQVSDLLARAAGDGRDIGEEFRFLDDGQSGASLVRPALERLRDLVAMSAIDVVYVHAPDRLARSYAHQAVLIEEFARAGAQVVFLNRPIGQSPEDNLLLQLQGMFADYDRARMLERSRRGKRYLALLGASGKRERAVASALWLRLCGPRGWRWCRPLRSDRGEGPGGPPHLPVGRLRAGQSVSGLTAAVRGRRAEPDRERPLEPQHALDAAVEPRLCRAGRLWEKHLDPVAPTATPGARSGQSAETPVPPDPSVSRALGSDCRTSPYRS